MIRAADVLAEARRVAGPGGHEHGGAGLVPGARPDPRRGHRRLGRPGRRRPARGRRRHVRARCRPAHRPADRRGRTATTYVASRGVRAEHRHGRRRPRRSTASRTRRTGRTGTPCGWPSLPGSLIVVGGGAIGAEMAQAFSRFGVRVTRARGGRPHPGRPRSPSPARWSPRCSRGRASRCWPARRSPRWPTPRAGSPSRSDGQALHADKLLVAAGRRPDSPTSGWTPSAWTRRARSIDDRRAAAGRRTRVCGRSATSPARARSRTCRCTRPAIAVRDILGQDGPAGDVPRGAARDVHRSRGRLGRDDREAGARRRPQRARRVRRTSPRPRAAGSPSGHEGLIKLVEDADRGVLVGATAVGPSGERCCRCW